MKQEEKEIRLLMLGLDNAGRWQENGRSLTAQSEWLAVANGHEPRAVGTWGCAT